MKVFVSSVIAEMEAFRDAVERAAGMLSHSTLRSEQIGARSASPQQACLDLVRQADVVILVLGSRYGTIQASGLSPTHEEFREARDRCSVLCFVQAGVQPDTAQAEFIREVQDWASGHYTAAFADASSLLEKVVEALHRLELTNATAPVDAEELANRARRFLQVDRGSPARLAVAIAFGPAQAVLRPSEIADAKLLAFVRQAALTGAHAVLLTSEGTQESTSGGGIALRQGTGEVAVDELGSVVTVIPFSRKSQRDSHPMFAVIEEDLIDQLELILAFSNQVIEYLDSRHRLSHFAPAARLMGVDHFGWQTRAEHARSPNSVSIGFGGPASAETLRPPHRPRSALQFDGRSLSEDLVALMKRARA